MAEIDWQCDDGICEHTDRVAGKCACYNKEVMTKEEVLDALTKLYDMCVLGSSEPDDGWSRIAGAISTAEDVARQEATDD